MPLFPVLDLEAIVQEKDKTRLNAVESYASGDVSIAKVEIQPGKGATFHDVTDNKYLDWQFALEIFVDESNKDFDFVEDETVLAGQLTEGAYSLADFCVELQTQLCRNSALNYAYVVSVNDSNVITVEAYEAITQVINLGGVSTTSGSVTLNYNGVAAATPVAYDEGISGVQSSLRTIPALSGVVVSGDRFAGYIVSGIPPANGGIGYDADSNTLDGGGDG